MNDTDPSNHFSADEDIVVMVFIGKGGQVVTHAEASDHTVGQLGGLLRVRVRVAWLGLGTRTRIQPEP